MSIFKIMRHPELFQLLTSIEKMKNPEFKVGEFVIKGKIYNGILFRDQPEDEIPSKEAIARRLEEKKT